MSSGAKVPGPSYETSNSEYGKGVLAADERRREERYAKVIDLTATDSALAVQLQSEAWQDSGSLPKPLQRPAGASWQGAIGLASPTIRELGSLPFPVETEASQSAKFSQPSPIARSGSLPLPEPREVSDAALRLRERLAEFGLRERKTEGDGACQFRAVADQMWGDQTQHRVVRQRALETLLLGEDRFRHFVHDEPWDTYLERMSRDDGWGDNLTLQAIADAFEVDMTVLTSFSSDDVIRVLASNGPQQRPNIVLGFYAEVHYVSVESTGSSPLQRAIAS